MKNYVFDLDGTLIDSRRVMFNALYDTIGELQLNINLSSIQSWELCPPEMLIKKIINVFGIEPKCYDELLIKYRSALKHYEAYNALFPCVFEVLNKLYKFNKRLFIISDRKYSDLSDLLKANDIFQFFTDFIGRDQYGLKPYCYSGDALINKYKLLKNETVYIGDKETDYLFAKRLGITFAYVNYSNEPCFSCENCDYILNNVCDILKI